MATQQTVISAGLLDFLAVALILLKVTGFITLSWIWVLAPWWIPLSITLGILVAAAFAGDK